MARSEALSADCCIAGGGPAGMMAGFLLARAGVDVVVLEKHADFLRDFRGDTVHPSTLELFHELGLLDALLERPHQELRKLTGIVGDTRINIADFSRLPVACPFIAFMPQWDFLDFLCGEAQAYPNFRVLMQSEVTNLIEDGPEVLGVIARGPGGVFEVHAALTIGADGRDSAVRSHAALPVRDLGAPIDVFWMRLPRKRDETQVALGRAGAGHIFVTIERGDYWQCAFVIPKGMAEQFRARGLAAFRRDIAEIAPEFADRVDALADWDEIRLLTVKVDRLERWCRPGLLMIGDAAHAMSPIGGVGINLAIQDAVAAANLLARPLARGAVTLADLRRVERRRLWPTRATQFLQTTLQNRVITRVLDLRAKPRPPLLLRLLDRSPWLQRIAARIVGLGFRPEHITTGQTR